MSLFIPLCTRFPPPSMPPVTFYKFISATVCLLVMVFLTSRFYVIVVFIALFSPWLDHEFCDLFPCFSPVIEFMNFMIRDLIYGSHFRWRYLRRPTKVKLVFGIKLVYHCRTSTSPTEKLPLIIFFLFILKFTVQTSSFSCGTLHVNKQFVN